MISVAMVAPTVITCLKMRLSDEMPANVKTVKFSPSGKMLAFAFFNELSVIRVPDLVTVFSVFCSDKITAVDWSPDSDHVLCLIRRRNLVEAFSLSSSECTCRIQEDVHGILSALWSPKASHILTLSEHAVRLSVWSLVGLPVAFIETPLMKAKDELAFSPDGKYLAVTIGRWKEYNILLYSTSSWVVWRRIRCTNDIDIPNVPLWSPNSCYIAMWDILDLRRSLLEIYSVSSGEILADFKSQPKNRMRGISSVVWSPNSQFLLIGCRDECIYVLNYVTWNVIGAFTHQKVVEDADCDIMLDSAEQFEVLRERPVKFTFIRSMSSPGIIKISVSPDGVHVASQTTLLPAIVWLWNLDAFELMAIIVFRQEVTGMRWSPTNVCLLVCNRSRSVSVWRSGKMYRLELNVGGQVRKGVWCPRKADRGDFLLFTASSFFLLSDLN